MKRSTVVPIAVGIAAALVVAVVGSTVTDLGPWYKSLLQPSWSPPDWAFPVGWTTIYILTTIAGITAWRHAEGHQRERVVGLFALNGFFNILWSLLFFGLRRPDWALFETAPFWLSIALLIVIAARSSTLARVLLLPYLAWVTYASAINWAVVRLNGPF